MRTVDRLPSFLRDFCTEQDMNKYSPKDHAAWRYIMHQGLPFFRKHAVHVYESGLQKTGLPLDRIPSIDFMDEQLQKIGWGAVPVVGFIPPWAFLEFQARSILPIATDMRSADHISYTPAPDIVHEAAGHAPILPDEGYANYLSSYAQLCTKAIYSKDDNDMYEAIRLLSDIKEKPGATAAQVKACEENLKATAKRCTYVSEQVRVARMSWWTNEYGLVGDLKDPKIYGAGLLSSLGESQAIYSPKVKKIRLSLECTNQSYDITNPQPQLYVAENMQHLIDVLGELDGQLAYRSGGLAGLLLAKEANAVTSVGLDSGVFISGRLVDFEHQDGEPYFLKWEGPVQLSFGGVELAGQGVKRHPSGFSCPLGPWFPEGGAKVLESKLQQQGFQVGETVEKEFPKGIRLKGRIQQFLKSLEGEVLGITFENCSITQGERVLYDPSWGPFDLPFGSSVVSVQGGPVDRSQFGEQELSEPTSTPGRDIPYTEAEKSAFELYERVRALRAAPKSSALSELTEAAIHSHPSEWLLMLELAELLKEVKSPVGAVVTHLREYPEFQKEELHHAIHEGLKLLDLAPA